MVIYRSPNYDNIGVVSAEMGRKVLRIDDVTIANEAKKIFGARSESDYPNYTMVPINDFKMALWWYILALLEKKSYTYTALYEVSKVKEGSFKKYLKLLLHFKFIDKKDRLYSIAEKGRLLLELFRT